LIGARCLSNGLDVSDQISTFSKACRGEPVPHTPIWLNRQAGRYMREYHEVKGDLPSLALFKDPERAARVTLDAQRILGVDAAILFADLLPILEPMGMSLDYLPGTGPVFDRPLRSAADIDALRVLVAEQDTAYIGGTITRILDDLPADIALIGFAGAPFTLASYAVEGRGSRNYVWVKKLMYEHPGLWDRLMQKLVDSVASYVALQIAAGVHAVQLFDSWVGCLSRADYARYVAGHTRNLMAKIRGTVPIIYFATGNGHLLGDMFATGPDVMALDWRTPLRETWDELGVTAVQGNLDPIVLCADRATVEEQAMAILTEVDGRNGHIFNLGHGIIPETPVDNVKFLVDLVHERSAR
jgi:uroporphyrinogen decarboxylase